jgi:HSP20 family molecular chaperone IbpA
VTEAAGEYRLLVEVPGATRESMEVVPGPIPGTLAIKLDARPPEKDDGRLLRNERGSRDGRVRYERVVPVAWDADTSTARAEIANGILTVTVPKRSALTPPPSKKDVV